MTDDLPDWDREPSPPAVYARCAQVAAMHIDNDPDYETFYRLLCADAERDPIFARLAVRTLVGLVAEQAMSTQGSDVAGARLWSAAMEALDAAREDYAQ